MIKPKRSGAGVSVGMLSVLGILLCVGTAHADGYEWRMIDGSMNNTSDPGRWDWGSANIQLDRTMSTAYGSNGWDPAGADRPNPRTISNLVFDQPDSKRNKHGLTDFVWQWGQFIDHDIDLTPDDSGEAFNITVPNGDPVFPDGTVMPLNRSRYDGSTGSPGDPRQQMNAITSWLDASNIYGSDSTRAGWLRETDPSKKGQLKVSTSVYGDLLPFNDGSQGNAGGPGTNLFVSGDVRANEQTGLTSMHTLFMREHNRWAEVFASADPSLSSDDVYNRARRILGAEEQIITYNEFLPALLGSQMGTYGGYDEEANGSICNEFSTAFYRLGHSMLSTEIKRLDDSGNVISDGNLSLSDAFFNPTRITDEGGIDPVLKGLASQVMQDIDTKVVGDVRNMLFGPPGAGGLDLASLNIQRGRDHGLVDYNTARVQMGLSPITSFNQITQDTSISSALRAAYGQTDGEDNVQLLDLWVGALAEDHMPGSNVGLMLSMGLRSQFEAMRAGDRFYYEYDQDLPSILAEVGLTLGDLEGRLLSDIITDNTGITNIQDNVFLIPTPGAGAALAIFGIAAATRRRRG